jgi:hypothetical protein
MLEMEIYFTDNEVVHCTVDSVFGWTYSGNYLLVHTEDGESKVTRPYYLGKIVRVVLSPGGTTH